MSAETLDYHHGKHHKAYVDKLNGFVADKGLTGSLSRHHPQGEGRRRQARVQQCRPALESQLLLAVPRAGRGSAPEGRLAALIDEGFGGTDAMLAKLKDEAVGHFSNGWAWLVLDGGALKITSLHDADTPVGL